MSDPRALRLEELVAKYATVSANSPEGLALVREIDTLKRDLLEQRLRDKPAKTPRRPWRGRVPERTDRTHWRGGTTSAPSPRRVTGRDGRAAAAGEDARTDDVDSLPFGGF